MHKCWLVCLAVALAGCADAERPPERPAPSGAPVAPRRPLILRASALPPPPPVSELDAENAVRYCKEALDAHVYAGSPDVSTAARRLAKALGDLRRVRAGDLQGLVLERAGGFPRCSWVSGHYRDGVYVPGGPPGGMPPLDAAVLAALGHGVESVLRDHRALTASSAGSE